MIRKLALLCLFIAILGAVASTVFGVWAYNYVTRDLPHLDRIEDYQPNAASQVFSSEGTLIAEFFSERRYPASLDEIPLHVRNAFLAAEDASFYSHPGIDVMSIARAFIKNLESGTSSQGGSTITQQVVKNLLLTSEKKYVRKIREAILAYRLERRLSKDDILQIYLNEIYLGNGAYGIKAAAKIYFHKELEDLTLAEGAILAGLPQAPSRFSPVRNWKAARRRQRYVLRQMESEGFVRKEEVDAAIASTSELKVYPVSQQNIFHAPYFVAELRRRLQEKWPELDPDRDGLQIYGSVEVRANEMAQRSVQEGLREVDKRRGWRGPLTRFEDDLFEQYSKNFEEKLPKADRFQAGELYPALVLDVLSARKQIRVLVGGESFELDLSKASWARRYRNKEDRVQSIRLENTLQRGDVIEVLFSLSEDGQTLVPSFDQTPDIESALVLLQPSSGKVVALVGGYSYQKSPFNRATQALRQPGSAFKPVVYLAAVDGFQYTPATIVHDSPRAFRVGDDVWQPANFDQEIWCQQILFLELALILFDGTEKNLVLRHFCSPFSPFPLEQVRLLLWK